jgi:hypothetical protein
VAFDPNGRGPGTGGEFSAFQARGSWARLRDADLRLGQKGLMAKLMFCGMSPVTRSATSTFNLETTTPTTAPVRSSTGPPLLPCCTWADICIRVGASRHPVNAFTIPLVTIRSEERSPERG